MANSLEVPSFTEPSISTDLFIGDHVYSHIEMLQCGVVDTQIDPDVSWQCLSFVLKLSLIASFVAESSIIPYLITPGMGVTEATFH